MAKKTYRKQKRTNRKKTYKKYRGGGYEFNFKDQINGQPVVLFKNNCSQTGGFPASNRRINNIRRIKK